MGKRRKNHPNNRPESGASPLDGASSPDSLGANEESLSANEELLSASELDDGLYGEIDNGAEPLASANGDLVVDANVLNAASDQAAAFAGIDAMEPADLEAMDPSDLETMDGLLAELLAQDGSVLTASEDVPDSLEAADVSDPAKLGFSAEPDFVAEPDFEDVALTLEALPPMESIPHEESAPEIPVEAFALLAEPAAEPVPGPEVLLAPEPEADSFDMDLLTSPEAFRQEGLNALLDEMLDETGIPEPPAPVEAAPEVPALMPLGPQPPLESVLGSIDHALESAPPVAGPAESSYSAPHHQKQFSQLDDYVVFTLAGADYAVPVRDVAEIGRVPGITRVPNVPEFVRGITNLRGEVVPVLNLPLLLGLQEAVLSARGRVLFLQARAHTSASGLLVDEVKGIQRIQSQQLEQVTGLMDDKITSVLRGVHGRGDRLLNVLDLEQLFQLPEFRSLESM